MSSHRSVAIEDITGISEHTLAQNLRTEMQTLRWQAIAAVALVLPVHLGAVWGIVAAHAP